jgi:RNA polymerase sigma-54 factor
MIRDIIQHEDKQKPLSDEIIQKMLSEQGFPIARRTVTKYREQLGFPIARMRR